MRFPLLFFISCIKWKSYITSCFFADQQLLGRPLRNRLNYGQNGGRLYNLPIAIKTPWYFIMAFYCLSGGCSGENISRGTIVWHGGIETRSKQFIMGACVFWLRRCALQRLYFLMTTMSTEPLINFMPIEAAAAVAATISIKIIRASYIRYSNIIRKYARV